MKSTGISSLIAKIGLLLKPQKKRALSSSIILIFQGITEGVGLLLILPLLSIVGIDSLSNSNSTISSSINRFFNYIDVPLSLSSVLIVYLLIISFYAILKYFQNINTAIISRQIAIAWRFHFFKLLSNSSWSKINTFKTSTLQEILTSEVRKLGSIGTQLVQFFSSFIIIFIYFTLSLLLSIKLTVLALIPVGILLLLNKPLNRKAYSLGQSLIQNNQALYKTIEEHLAAIRLVKTYNKENQQAEIFKEISNEVEAHQLQFTRNNNRTRLIFELIAAVAITVYV
ncbi:MAG: ABC transporter ATP-binding protein, partial [Flavobacteriales bacterium]|nr:ABC transporter ATP-binding protein [Flavobacteriales bacterium]